MSYITKEGWERLSKELDYLWRIKRPEITKAVSDAAAMGDRSENAEYIYGKKQLREIDARIRFLTKRLDNIKVVDRKPDQQDKIFFGAYVTLETQSGDTKTIRIVGGDEFDHQADYISIRSPLARALLGKSVGDKITLNLEAGTVNYIILLINY